MDPLGSSPVQLHPSFVFIDLVFYNAVAARNFEYKITNILDKPCIYSFAIFDVRLTRSIEYLSGYITALPLGVQRENHYLEGRL